GLPARRAALAVLVRVAQGGFADVLLGHRLTAFPSAADRRLITRLVLGTLAWQGRLDYELARISTRALETLDPEILAILRLALYQIRIMTRVPQHAAVDTAVTLARATHGDSGAAGFVNAILRAALRKPIPLPDRSKDEIGYLTVAYSHPRWMVERFVAWFGIAAAETLMAANNDAAPNVIRLNLLHGEAMALVRRLNEGGIDATLSSRLRETAVLTHAPMFESRILREGLCYPQSEVSQLAAAMLGPPPAATVVDCAAAPGGKATHLAEMAGREGRVLALDISRSGLRKVDTIAAMLGHRHITAIQADCAAPMPLRASSFSHVLLDAPCTGSGTLREHPEIRWRLDSHDFLRMAGLQARMLQQSATLIRPGGVIVYSVCSLAPDEGEGVINAFLEGHPCFRVDRTLFSDQRFDGLIGKDGFMRTRPDQGGLDGFFAARLVRIA
ncbi:MAG TPA: 16S rRNA (cytosine(967)-C(5))-methyltransferase RsmB, partial [Candidatus Binataceae bacterium]|nr:16S rRNA (cytosine(967)-C(5))-methyltransferase RsmB [Candidatus Binataceae bacterium]